MNVSYTTVNREPSGRASPYYKDSTLAFTQADEQNVKAVQMGIKSAYTVVTIDDQEVPAANRKEIR